MNDGWEVIYIALRISLIILLESIAHQKKGNLQIEADGNIQKISLQTDREKRGKDRHGNIYHLFRRYTLGHLV